MQDMPAPPPPYLPPSTARRTAPASLSTLPLHLLHHIVSLTLDPRATPSRWAGDEAEERVRRVWGVFRGCRGVDRRFYLVSTALLRHVYLPTYTASIHPLYTSSPLPEIALPLDDTEPVTTSVLEFRKHETAVLDRYIAIRVGEELRGVESELSEGSGGVEEVFGRFQPAARLEDLLLTLPPSLIAPSTSPSAPPARGSSNPAAPARTLPLPHSNLSVTLTPSWVQIHLHARPVQNSGSSGMRGKDLVIEVRRGRSLEDCVMSVQEGLEDVKRGLVPWGGRIG